MMIAIEFPAPTEDHLLALHQLLTARGWVIEDFGKPDPHAEPDAETGWVYPLSYAGVVLNHVDDITPERLHCSFSLGEDSTEFLVVSTGNYGGCEDHMSGQWRFPFDEEDDRLSFAELGVLLDELEPSARARDPRALIECRFFGPCGSP